MALREKALAWVIRVYKPDLIHSLEMQHAGYLTLSARELLGGHFPTWAVTIWGSDLYLFGRLEEHQPKIKSILAHCDFFGCECSRDQVIAKEMGFQGKVLPPLPATGGFDLEYCETLKITRPVSERREIVLKGYQHFAGRALFGLRALTLCADQLKGYQVNIFAASPEVVLAAQLFSQNTGLLVNVISTSSHETDDDSILKLFGRARISIGLSISDGIPRTMLEAMVMGAFPIQSCTACADEWIVDGESGLIVPPEDPELIAQAIRRALSDDSMVDRAAEINARVAKERLDTNILSQQVIKIYQDIFVEGKS
jgi:hypothetical protein